MIGRHLIVRRAYVAWRAKPFVWGETDCSRWAAHCAELVTGRDPLAEFVGRYDTQAGALRIMSRRGWRDMGDVAAACYREIRTSSAQAADWAHCIDHLGNDALGVVCGAHIAVRSLDDMFPLPLTAAIRAFRVE